MAGSMRDRRGASVGLVQALFVVGKDFDDAAVAHAAVPAAVDHALEFLLERVQPGDALLDFFEPGGRDGVGLCAGACRMVLEVDQGADRVDVEAEFAGMADEGEAADIGLAVEAAVAVGPRRLGQQSDLLVVADRRNLDAARLARPCRSGLLSSCHPLFCSRRRTWPALRDASRPRLPEPLDSLAAIECRLAAS